MKLIDGENLMNWKRVSGKYLPIETLTPVFQELDWSLEDTVVRRFPTHPAPRLAPSARTRARQGLV